ncbi:hypothetical protein QR680_015575 [Steinernema hermaphroditum]|uniref:Uncharacterized protein n=1 Tax=Steinernema hermaphroditum TaxID=289476 RepID=A0AA39H892_9BILA|nr:hypothetical protein QR680_015575 [Steinernema hermaphroditum]
MFLAATEPDEVPDVAFGPYAMEKKTLQPVRAAGDAVWLRNLDAHEGCTKKAGSQPASNGKKNASCQAPGEKDKRMAERSYKAERRPRISDKKESYQCVTVPNHKLRDM